MYIAPGTTWAMYAIGYMERGNTEEADRLFNKSYAPYVTQPFKVCHCSTQIITLDLNNATYALHLALSNPKHNLLDTIYSMLHFDRC